MARSEARTALSLDAFGKIAGIAPLHLNQIDLGTCGQPIMQHAWQSPGRDIGREDLAVAISLAEEMIESWLGFPLLPRWIEDEVDVFPSMGLGTGASTLRLRQGHYITGGIETKTLIEAGVGVEYSDEDGDGWFETATIGPIATTILNQEEIAVYFPGEGGADAWEVRPIKVGVDAVGGEVTITCHREQLVNPDLWETIVPEDISEVDRDEAANFLATVDVYRHYNDPQRQVQFLWGCSGCGGAGCQTCGYTTQYGCIRGIDPELGLVTFSPGTWNAETMVFDSASWSGSGWLGLRPERVRAWYLAGQRDFRQARVHHDMAQRYQMAVAVLAMAYVGGQLCPCMGGFYSHWSEDLTYSFSDQSTSQSYKIGKRILDCPFGTTRGAIRAWELVSRDRLGESANFVRRW